MKNVFINCPFDNRYTPLFRIILFSVLYYGFNPRTALEDSDCVTNRLEKISSLIDVSIISIHDLSRIKSKDKNEYSRFNMPFELGIDFGIRLKGSMTKKFLILEGEKYSYQKALSDYAGFDVFCHKNDPQELVKIIRDWFVNNRYTGDILGPTALWYKYNDCWGYIYDSLMSRGYTKKDTKNVPYNEYLDLVREWLKTEGLIS